MACLALLVALGDDGSYKGACKRTRKRRGAPVAALVVSVSRKVDYTDRECCKSSCQKVRRTGKVRARGSHWRRDGVLAALVVALCAAGVFAASANVVFFKHQTAYEMVSPPTK